MSDDSLLAQLAEEYTRELRAGRQRAIEEYTRKHPELAERIQELFPTLMMLEGMAASRKAAKEVSSSRGVPGSTSKQNKWTRNAG